MIAIRDLTLARDGFYLSALGLEVRRGEIYFLLNRLDQDNDLLFQVLGGYQPAGSGEISYDGIRPLGPERPAAAIFIDRVKDRTDFDAEARLDHWFDFLCALGLSREKIFQTLLVGNFHERQLKEMVRDLHPETFKLAYLAACLAEDSANIVINDFIRGAGKNFELKFNKLLLQKKAAGGSILFLGNDIIYAAEIADRIGFVKDGLLLFEAEAADVKDMDIKDLYYKFLS
jgi:ABC-type multidrug transport system ATPase subunit